MSLVDRHLRVLTGELDNENYDLLERVIFETIDDVIGLDVMIDPEPYKEHREGVLSVSCRDGQLILSKLVFNDGGSEILVNGGLSPQWAMWRANGFYVVKSGGMQQGICSVGLMPVDEAQVRLNPRIKIVPIKLSGPS